MCGFLLSAPYRQVKNSGGATIYLPCNTQPILSASSPEAACMKYNIAKSGTGTTTIDQNRTYSRQNHHVFSSDLVAWRSVKSRVKKTKVYVWLMPFIRVYLDRDIISHPHARRYWCYLQWATQNKQHHQVAVHYMYEVCNFKYIGIPARKHHRRPPECSLPTKLPRIPSIGEWR